LAVRSIERRRDGAALLGSDFGDIDGEAAERAGFELAPVRLVAVGLGQAGDAVALKAAMQRRSRQVRVRGLERIETIIERQKSIAVDPLAPGQHPRGLS
jgi:hypothetical protein